MESISLSDGVTAYSYPYSEYVICVEVTQRGKSLGSFCSDVSQFADLDQEEIISLIYHHMKQINSSPKFQRKNVTPLYDDLELQYTKHTEDLYVIEVLKKGTIISTFCADCESFNEWLEDKEQLYQIVRSFMKQKNSVTN